MLTAQRCCQVDEPSYCMLQAEDAIFEEQDVKVLR